MKEEKKKVLVVDDEENLRHMMRIILTQEGYEVLEAENGNRALDITRNGEVDLILCDIRMPGMDGMAFLKRVGAMECPPIVIMMSAYGTIETAVTAMKMGAYDYVSKPFQPDEVVLTIQKAFEHQALKDENRELKRRLATQGLKEVVMVGKSAPMKRLRSLLDRVARYDSTILITGESGTGKELVAREIHRRSHRGEGPFVPINCAAIPENLFESELFGYLKGAFTGAGRDKKGLIQEARGGTLFLDEVGEVPLSVQVKLLRFLQDGQIRRIGETMEYPVDVRVIAATNQNLEQAVWEKRFREDLFFRLNVIQIHVPPLRERREDIPALVEYFLEKYSRRYNKPVPSLDSTVFDILMTSPWRGNIRELENVVERGVLLSEGGQFSHLDLPEEFLYEKNPGDTRVKPHLTLREARRQLEKRMIQRVLLLKGGDKKGAADSLGITLRSLQYKIKEYHLKT